MLSLAVGWKARSRKVLCAATIAVASVCGGITAAQLEAFFYPGEHIALFSGELPRLAQVEVEILHPPRVLVVPSDGKQMPPRQVALGEARRLLTWDGWVDTSGQLLFQIHEPHPELRAGQTVRTLGYLQRPAPAMNPAQFDWAAYYREQRIVASLTVQHAGNIHVVADHGVGVVGWLRTSVRSLLASGFAADDSHAHALLRALLLGDADPELRDIQDQFRATGTSHHLSISGLHVAVLGGFVFLLLRVACVRPRVSAVVTAGFVALYGVVALPSPPVVRSVVLCLTLAIGFMGRRAVDGLQLLALSAVGMLVWHPMDLYNAGFQLSFGTVAGLILFTKPVRDWLVGYRDVHTQLAPREPGVVPAVVRWADGELMTAVAAALVAWVVSMPMVAYHFGQLNPWAVPASIILAPIVFAALIVGFLKVLLTLVWPSMAPVWATVAELPIAAMRWVLDVLSLLPKSDVPLPAPHWTLLVAFYVGLLLLLIDWQRHTLRLAMRLVPAVSLAGMLLLPFHTSIFRPKANGLRVTFLHVGAGQCAVVEPPGGRVILIDAGSFSLADPLRKCIAPYLRARGITGIDTLLISHGDLDHFSAVGRIVDAYGVREVLVGHRFTGHDGQNPAAVDLLERLADADRPPRVVSTGDVIPIARDTTLRVLWPGPGVDLPDNDCSVVLKLTHAGRSVLFTGDIQEAAMRALLHAGDADLKADVLVAPHHGSAESSTKRFLDAVKPGLILSSNDRSLTQKQVRFEQAVGDRTLLRTHTNGAITLLIDDKGTIDVETVLPTARQSNGAEIDATPAVTSHE